MNFFLALTVKSLPIIIANVVPVFFAKLLPSLDMPVDFGFNFTDGQRIFGKNKTLRGVFSAIAFGTLAGYVLNLGISAGFMLSLGTMCGDLLTSFIKRRMKVKPGQRFQPYESEVFVLTAVLFAPALFSVTEVIAMMILSPAVYVLFNYLAYKTGLKNVPW